MIHLSLFSGWGRFSGLVGEAYGRCLTATNPTIPSLNFSYTSQSAADLGAAAHGPIKKWGQTCGFRATPRATASWAGLRGRYAQRGLSPVVRFVDNSVPAPTRSVCAAATLYAQQPRYALLRDWFRRAGPGACRQFWRASQHDHGELPKDCPWR